VNCFSIEFNNSLDVVFSCTIINLIYDNAVVTRSDISTQVAGPLGVVLNITFSNYVTRGVFSVINDDSSTIIDSFQRELDKKLGNLNVLGDFHNGLEIREVEVLQARTRKARYRIHIESFGVFAKSIGGITSNPIHVSNQRNLVFRGLIR